MLLCNIYIIRKARTRQNNDIDGFVYVAILDKNHTNFFLKLAIIGRTKNSKIMAIEPMNRMAGSSISRDINRRAVSRPSETITIQVMSISGNAPEWRISRIVCVSKNGSFRYRLIISVMARGLPSVWSKI